MGSLYNHLGKFTMVSNEAIEDSSLSFKAKGILIYLLSRPYGWNFSAERISEASKEGIEAVRSGLSELEAGNYLLRTPARNERGMLSGYDYHLNGGNTLDEFTNIGLSVPGKPEDGLSVDGLPPNLNNTDINNTDISNTERINIEEKVDKSTKKKAGNTDYTDDFIINAVSDEFHVDDISASKSVESIKAFIDMRKSIKKPLLQTSFRRWLISAVKKSSGNLETFIEMVDQSTINSWQGIFPVVENGAKGTGQRWNAVSSSEEIDRSINEMKKDPRWTGGADITNLFIKGGR